MRKPPALASTFAVLALTASCGVPEQDGDSDLCEAGQCDGLPFLDQLKGREDPVAKWLRPLGEQGVIDAEGVYHGDKAGEVAPKGKDLFYAKLLEGLATVQGCAPSALINYALTDDLITGTPDAVYPRLVSTVCNDKPELVTNAFVATLGNQHRDGSGDLELDELEMFAWDPTAQKFFFYAAELGEKDGDLQIEVEPARCMKCHLTPLDTDPVAMPRLPIMNELTKPWTHWDAGEGGVSESFNPKLVEGKPLWEEFGAIAGGAPRLERKIRDANQNLVTAARGKQLFRPAKLDEAMGLIRPLFCDEQVNYVTELATGEVPLDAVVSGGIKGPFRGIQATWPWAWFNNDTLQLPAAGEDERLFMMPVRGVAETTFEPQLQGVLSPAHILAVRALDWKKPVFSDFRCNLWRDAWTAFQADAPTLSGRNRDAVKVLFEEIMKRGGMSTRNIAGGTFVAISDATEANVRAARDAIASGNIPTTCGDVCEVDAMGFGNAIDAYVESLSTKRDELRAERDRRVCKVIERIDGVGLHSEHNDARVANEPSFVRIPVDGIAVDTRPTCE